MKDTSDHRADRWADEAIQRTPEPSPAATLGLGLAGFGAMALAGKLSPLSVGEVSGKRYRANVIIPAPGTFGIWGFIYTGLGALLVHQALPGEQDNPRYRPARSWLAATPWANAAWIGLTGHEQVSPAYGVLHAQWLGGRAMYKALEIDETPAGGLEKWLRVPVSVYAGWLGVAEVLSAVNLAIDLGWDARTPDPLAWGTAALVVTAAGAAHDVDRHRDPWLGVPVVAALVGIAVKGERQEEPGASKVVGRVAAGLAAAGAAWLVPRIVGWLRGG